jgi:hypothetical protein
MHGFSPVKAGLFVLALSQAMATPLDASPRVLANRVWYDTGHRLVARIAELRMTPRARAAVRDLLGGQDLATASVWADEIKGRRRDTEPLHYVNIPLEANAYVPVSHCPGGRCLIAAIETNRRILSDSTAPLPRRAEALRFLVHFVADLHQPLHVSDNDDRGGNLRRVRFFGTARNLHEVWDGELIFRSGLSESRYLEHLRRRMDSLDLAALQEGTLGDWAMEGHRVAAEHVYRLPSGGRLGERYLRESLPLVDRALISAGVRLAAILNDALASYPTRSTGLDVPTAESYSDSEARAHVGEVATVVGTVVTVRRSRAGNIFLNFGGDYPHQTFSGVVLHPREDWQRSLDTLAGRRVGVRGLIRLYRGQVEIVIKREDQLSVVP